MSGSSQEVLNLEEARSRAIHGSSQSSAAVRRPGHASVVTYRPDIDVLRAFAVLSVVFFHLDIPFISGGFIGVDVFFVISGYLITLIFLVPDTKLSILDFYERRARRILPALAVVVAATLVAGYFIMLPTDLRHLGQSTLAVALFGSNIYFWMTLDYFDAAAHSKPLLHTWSLAVEEQYYIVFPYVLWAVRKYIPQKMALAFGAIAILSFMISVIWPNYDRGDAFYLPHYRAWEPLIGALLAMLRLPPPRTSRGRFLVAAMGIALIFIPIFLYDAHTPFPGLSALPPCLGAAAIIYASVRPGEQGAALLHNRRLIYVGKISYSFYLWHWPIIVFMGYYLIHELTIAEKMLAVGLAFGLAALSLRFIETPTRKIKIGQPRLFAAAIAACLLMGGLGYGAHATFGLPGRFAAPIATVERPATYFEKTCFLTKGQNPADWRPQRCSFGATAPAAAKAVKANRVLLWGDSHAAHLMPGLIDGLRRTDDVALVEAAYAGCPPLLDYEEAGNPRCSSFNRRILDYIHAARPDTVVISARWNAIRDPYELQRLMARTIAAVRAEKVSVILLGESPSYSGAVPTIYYMLERRGLPASRYLASEPFRADDVLGALARDLGVRFISPRPILCQERDCAIEEKGQLLFFDESHFTEYGSRYIVDRMHLLKAMQPVRKAL